MQHQLSLNALSLRQAPGHHRQSLLAILREAVTEQDHDRAAVAAVTLLAAQVSIVMQFMVLLPLLRLVHINNL